MEVTDMEVAAWHIDNSAGRYIVNPSDIIGYIHYAVVV